MQVAYITSPHYLDCSIEYINELKKETILDVYVVLNSNYLKATILNIKDYTYPTGKLLSFYDLAGKIENFDLLETYVKGCHSFNFILFPDKSTSIQSVIACRNLAAAINKNVPSIIHFDDISLQLWSLGIFLKSNWKCTNVHDPEPHSGERDWRRNLARLILYPGMKAFIVFSAYSNKRFNEIYKPKPPVYTLALTPYYFYSKILPHDVFNELDKDDLVLLFFGRISKYKGINELVRAFKNIYKYDARLKLIIAGRGNINNELDVDLQSEIGNGIILYNRFIANEEIAGLMQRANYVVCPYRDATQSGVVMTAFAFQKKVIVSEVGGLYEAVIPGKNGYVYNPREPNGLEIAFGQVLEKPALPVEFKIDNKYSAAFNSVLLLDIYALMCNSTLTI